MKEKHIILRSVGTTGNTGFLGGPAATPFGFAPAVTGVKVEVDDIEKSLIPQIAKNRDVVAVAPAMPMKLIAPLASAAATPAAGTMAWGVQAVGAVSSPFSGDGIVVSILDTGIDNTHAAFTGVTLVEKNFTGDANGSDQHGHGTHCAGTVLGRDVSGVRIGVARGVKKAFIGKVLGAQGGSSDAIAQGIQWAVQEGANVISMSLGMDFPGFQNQLVQNGLPTDVATSRALEGYRLNVQLFEKLAAMVKAMGDVMQTTTILIAAAGNESRTNINPDFKIAVSPPAVSDGFVSVAALGQSPTGFMIAPFSNTNAIISGPGVDITSAKMGGGLTAMSGTSMATPHVAGVTALWAQKQRAIGPLTAALLSAKLIASGDLAGLQPGFNAMDVGSGMVFAPQN